MPDSDERSSRHEDSSPDSKAKPADETFEGDDAPNDDDADNSSEKPSSSAATAAGAAGKRRRRKHHHKSQLGCIHCKRRKIKCQETFPSCLNCRRKGLICQYPNGAGAASADAGVKEIVSANGTSSYQMIQLQWSPITFNLTDMRLFHNFLFKTHPKMPMESDHMWVGDVPASAHHHLYLMHAMLAFSATHLDRTAPESLHQVALQHRTAAIEGLNQALSQFTLETCSPADRDALLGTCYILVLHSTYLADGLSDFLTLTRGCGILTAKIRQAGNKTGWDNLDPEDHIRGKIKKSETKEKPELDQDVVQGMYTAVKELDRDFLSNEEHELCRQLVIISEVLPVSPLQAYLQTRTFWYLTTIMPAKNFAEFIRPTNVDAQRILAHWLALFLLLSEFFSIEIADENLSMTMSTIKLWIETISANVETIVAGKLSPSPGRILNDTGSQASGTDDHDSPAPKFEPQNPSPSTRLGSPAYSGVEWPLLVCAKWKKQTIAPVLSMGGTAVNHKPATFDRTPIIQRNPDYDNQ